MGRKFWIATAAALCAGAVAGLALVQAHTVKHDSSVGLFTTSTIDGVLEVIGAADSAKGACRPKRDMQLVRNRGDKVMKEKRTRDDGIVVLRFEHLKEAKYHLHLKARDIAPSSHKHICTGDSSESQKLGHSPD